MVLGSASVKPISTIGKDIGMMILLTFFQRDQKCDYVVIKFVPSRIELIISLVVTPAPFGLRPAVLVKAGFLGDWVAVVSNLLTAWRDDDSAHRVLNSNRTWLSLLHIYWAWGVNVGCSSNL